MHLQRRHWMTLVVIALGIITPPVKSQVSPSPFVVPQYFDNSGHACAGCKLASFAAGTSTPLATFSDPAGVFPNANPTILDSAGRARIYLTGAAYKLVLSTASGVQIWSVDQVTSSNNGLLFSNNDWFGTNTFHATTNFLAPVNFNVGFTSLGPNTLGGGGSISGTYSGSPIFSGAPVFSGMPFFNAGFSVNNNATFNGAIISTVATGNAPFLVSSTTVNPNLNANFLEGCDWASPCAIGTTTPANGFFTGLRATVNFQIAGGVLVNGMKGTDITLLTAGTVSGVGNTLCVDANGGATTTGCASKLISTGKLGSASCTPASSSFATCTNVITISPAQPDTNYIPSCTGQTPGDPRMIIEWSAPTSTTTITATVETMGTTPAPFADVYCSGISNH
jgi:hypothetical protein